MSSSPLPLPLPLLESFALTSSLDARQSLLAQRVDVSSDDYHFLALLAYQTEDGHTLAHAANAANASSTSPPSPLLHQSKAYLELLLQYRQRFPHSSQLRTIELRHALLGYPTASANVQEELLRRIQSDYTGVRFEHSNALAQQADGAEDSAQQLPSRLDPAQLELTTLVGDLDKKGDQRGLTRYLSSSPLALDVLARYFHSHPQQVDGRRQFLANLSHPAVPHLVELIAADLRLHVTTFGQHRVHSALSGDELEQLHKQWPDVALQSAFVAARLDRQVPDGGLDGVDEEKKAAWYEEQAKLVLSLPAVHNDLKANTLYHVLSFRLQRPAVPLERDVFLAFLALPLPARYPLLSDADRPRLLKREPPQMVNLRVSRGVLFPPINQGSGFPTLIQEYTQRLYRELPEEKKCDKLDDLLAQYVAADWVHQQRAIARLETVDNLSAALQEKYQGWLGGQLMEVRDKEILSFLPSSSSRATTPAYPIGDPIELTLTLKNVGRTLLVKVYRINAAAYYRMEGKEVDVANLDLGGVVAHFEQTIELPDYSPYHRFTHPLAVASMLGEAGVRGVWVCEVTAKGQKVRALVRRGCLSYLSHPIANGVLLQLIDVDHSTSLQSSRVHLAGHSYDANADGFILLPYAVSSSHQPMVLTATDSNAAEFSSLVQFGYPDEHYHLGLSVHVDPESLLGGGQSEIVLRAALTVNQRVVPISLLKKVRLHLHTVHGDGVSSTAVLSEVELDEAVDFAHPFSVPARLRSITVTLHGEVARRSVNDKVELQASRTLQVSTALPFISELSNDEEGEKEGLDDLYLRLGAEGYAAFVLGKAGEAIARRPVRVQLSHRYLSDPLIFQLQSDDSGRVLLGFLPHILSVSLSTSSNGRRRTRRWDIDAPQQSAATSRHIHAREGELITVAYPSASGLLSPISFPPSGTAPSLDDLFCLLQVDVLDITLVRRRLPLASTLSVQAGQVELKGLKAGRYALLMKAIGRDGSRIDVIVVPASSPLLSSFVVDHQRVVELAYRQAKPSLAAVTRNSDGSLLLRVAHPTASTRLHVIASHFVSDTSFLSVGAVGPSRAPLLRPLTSPTNVFLGQCTLGDESRYILQRKAASKRVGNLLPRPSLLNNELERGATTFDDEPSLKADQAYAPPPPPPGGGLSGATSTFGAPQHVPRGAMPAMAPMAAAPRMQMASRAARAFDGVDMGFSLFDDGEAPSKPSGDAEWPSGLPASIDFLSQPSFRMWNAPLNEQGELLIPADALLPHHSHVDVLIVDSDDAEGETVSRARCPILPLESPAVDAASTTALRADVGSVEELQSKSQKEASTLSLHPHYRDLRYFPALGSSAELVPVVELQRVTPLLPSAELTVADRHSAQVAVYDSLDDLFHLLHTLSSSQGSSAVAKAMDDFSFILRWPRLSDDEKAALYSEYACHELHVFLYTRDAPFFTSIVLPFIRQRQQPSVLDRLLMGEDVSVWADSSAWLQLNVLEQLLLAMRSAERGDAALSSRLFLSIEQRAQAQPPPSLEEQARRFDTALHLKSLLQQASDDEWQDDEDEEEDGAEMKAEADVKEDAEAQQRFSDSRETAKKESKEGEEGGAPRMRKMKMANMDRGGPPPAGAAEASVTSSVTSSRSTASNFGGGGFGAAPSFSFAAAVPTSFSTTATITSMPLPRRVFTAPPTTKELQEKNWWAEDPHALALQPQRVTPSPLWGELAKQRRVALTDATVAKQPFLSSRLTEPTGSFTEVMAALALVALPFASARVPASLSRAESSLTITAATPVVVFHQERLRARQKEKGLISATATYFDPLDRYVDVDQAASASASASSSPLALLLDPDSDRQNKLLTEFTSGRTYTCRVVLFNPSPFRVKVRVLQQVPEGALSVGGGMDSLTRPLHLAAVSSVVLESSFYFPALGSFTHQAVQISTGDVVVGYTDAQQLPVRAKAALTVDATSWSHLAAAGTDAQLLQHLTLPSTNVHTLDWTALAWRWRQRKAFWQSCVRIARERLVFDELLWAYSIYHREVDTLKLWLPTLSGLSEAVGPFFASPLLSVDAEHPLFDRYRHLEYRPLIASRAHPFLLDQGRVQNRELKAHLTDFLHYVAFRYSALQQWTAEHRLQLCYLLLLQERVDEAVQHFRAIQRPMRADADDDVSLHYDYLAAYLCMYSEPSEALSIAKRYLTYPVNKKRRLFEQIEETVAEITAGRRDEPIAGHPDLPRSAQQEDADTRDREMEALAATEPSLDFSLTAEGVAVTYSNVQQLTLSVHVMDLEPLFTTRPFLNSEGATSVASSSSSPSTSSSSLLYLVPNYEQRVELPASPSASGEQLLPLPAAFRQSNLLVSLKSGSVLQTRPHYSHGLSVALMESFGQLCVTARASGKALSRVYVKVYARERAEGGEGGSGGASFYKDGYTDWRGRFDYASLSTARLDRVERFAILLQSDDEGAVVKEARPPGKTR